MAIDPRISLGVEVPKIDIKAPDPWLRVQRMMTLRDMMQRRELQAQEAQARMETQRLRQEALRQQAQDELNLRQMMSAPPPAAAPVVEANPMELPGYEPEPAAVAPTGAQPRWTQGQLVGVGGVKRGLETAKTLEEIRREEQLTRKAELDNQESQAKGRGNIAQAILLGGSSEAYMAGLKQALRRQYITQEEYDKFAGRWWNSPEVKAELQTIVGESTAAIDQVKQAREQEKWEVEKPGAIAEAGKKVSEAERETITRAAGRLAAAAARGRQAFEAALAQETPELQQFFAGSPNAYEVMKRAQDPDKYTATVQGEYGKMTPVAPAVFAQQKQLRSMGPPRAGVAAGGDEALADTVIANPEYFNQLTPTAKTRIGPLLEKKGFTGFGKPLAESAIGKISNSRSAIQSLQDLRETLTKYEQYIGPISGVQALNPYSEANKAKAVINVVRQRVGKALEEGVLRKEDEEKYKTILSTLYDVPSLAIFKTDNLVRMLENDIRIFEEEQRRGGRNVPAREAPPPAGGKDKRKPLGEIFK